MKGGLFDCIQSIAYPPFKNGLYLEEYIIQRYEREGSKTNRTYIPLKWTNFQLHPNFDNEKASMQQQLNHWVSQHPNPNGYFTVTQHADGPALTLPPNTILCSPCRGTIQIPLLYMDNTNRLENMPKKSFAEKTILCSFVGANTHHVRKTLTDKLGQIPSFELYCNKTWSLQVNQHDQELFIDTTLNSKFALAPRGYSRTSFRFYEVFQLGSVPVYVWDDIIWLPYLDRLDYSKCCIVINIKDIDSLDERLSSIDETKYNEMINEYNKIKHMFQYDFMYDYIMEEVNKI